MPTYEIHLPANCSVNNTVVRIPLVPVLDRNKTEEADAEDDNYDSRGAMQFIIATVLVYSVMSVFCTLINRIKRTRGKSHQNYLQDESVARYLKKENLLKFDGHRSKLVSECNRITEQVKEYERRQLLAEFERDLSSDFTQRPEVAKKGRRKNKDMSGMIGKMGMSLFYLTGQRQSLSAISKDEQPLQKGVEGKKKPSKAVPEVQIIVEDYSNDQDTVELSSNDGTFSTVSSARLDNNNTESFEKCVINVQTHCDDDYLNLCSDTASLATSGSFMSLSSAEIGNMTGSCKNVP